MGQINDALEKSIKDTEKFEENFMNTFAWLFSKCEQGLQEITDVIPESTGKSGDIIVRGRIDSFIQDFGRAARLVEIMKTLEAE